MHVCDTLRHLKGVHGDGVEPEKEGADASGWTDAWKTNSCCYFWRSWEHESSVRATKCTIRPIINWQNNIINFRIADVLNGSNVVDGESYNPPKSLNSLITRITLVTMLLCQSNLHAVILNKSRLYSLICNAYYSQALCSAAIYMLVLISREAGLPFEQCEWKGLVYHGLRSEITCCKIELAYRRQGTSLSHYITAFDWVHKPVVNITFSGH